MKSTAIFFVIFAGSVFCSCSKAEITATPVSQTRAGDNEVSLLFTKDNLSESQAIEFATHFLKKTPFFYTWDVLHFLPRDYIQYNEPFEVWYSGFTIHFRGIDVGIAAPVTAGPREIRQIRGTSRDGCTDLFGGGETRNRRGRL